MAFAVEWGWSTEQPEDRTVPTAGFGSDGLLHLSYGARSFAGRLTADFKISLTGPDGRARASLPAPRADDDADAVKAAKKQLTASRKEAKNVLSVRRSWVRAPQGVPRRPRPRKGPGPSSCPDATQPGPSPPRDELG